MSDYDAQAQQGPKPDPALKRLDRFVGTWSMEGHLVGSSENNIKARPTTGGCPAASSWSSA